MVRMLLCGPVTVAIWIAVPSVCRPGEHLELALRDHVIVDGRRRRAVNYRLLKHAIQCLKFHARFIVLPMTLGAAGSWRLRQSVRPGGVVLGELWLLLRGVL